MAPMGRQQGLSKTQLFTLKEGLTTGQSFRVSILPHPRHELVHWTGVLNVSCAFVFTCSLLFLVALFTRATGKQFSHWGWMAELIASCWGLSMPPFGGSVPNASF